MTIESQVADVVLQRPIEITIDNDVYKVAPPSTATLILVSELISQLPKLDLNTDSEQITTDVLRTAKDFKPVGDMLAVMIIGAKALRTDKMAAHSRKILAEKILLDYAPEELQTLFGNLLKTLQIAPFFALSAFLQDLNITKPTREADETKMTASGPQS